MAAGLAGLFGGPSRTIQAEGEADLKVKTPTVLRNGMIFETIVEVRLKQPVDNLVIGVAGSLWQDMTINTMIPAAGEESYMNGFRHFAFGEFDQGDTFRFKIDGQINPPLFDGNFGVIAAFDDKRKLTSIPVNIEVLP